MSTEFDLNPAQNNNFILSIEALKVDYFARSVTFPSLMMPGADTPYRGAPVSMPSNSRGKEDISVEFILAEDLSNYVFFRKWALLGIKGDGDITECLKDITVAMLDSNKRPIPGVKPRFLHAFPTTISALTLEHGVVDPLPLTFTVNFSFAKEVWE